MGSPPLRDLPFFFYWPPPPVGSPYVSAPLDFSSNLVPFDLISVSFSFDLVGELLSLVFSDQVSAPPPPTRSEGWAS